jgi:hypothetical protein
MLLIAIRTTEEFDAHMFRCRTCGFEHYCRVRRLEETTDVQDVLFSSCLCCVRSIVGRVKRPSNTILVSRLAAYGAGRDAGG